MSRRNAVARRKNNPQQPKAKITPLYGSANYSGTYDMTAEVLTEASLAKQNRSLSLDWDETEGMNIPSSMRSSSGLSEQDRKETLLTAYIQNCWISACIDVIAKRITSGGFAIEPLKQGQDDDADRQTLFDFCSLINENWDFLQIVRSIVTDLLIFGESYAEIVWQGKIPVQLHKIDCMTMSYSLAPNGQITGYSQTVSHQQDPIPFSPDEIIRWWFPHPRASMKAMSPIERILNPTAADQKMVDWTQTFFRKGSKPPYWIETAGTEEEARRFVKYMKENYQGVKNANAPIITYGGAQLHEYNKSIIDIDFQSGRKMAREEILSVFGVPPAAVGVIESGNIGGGTGESQEKSLQYNTCDPIRQLVFEKFNYRITKKGFGITNWKVNTRYGDYRSDDLISNIHDKGIRNGSVTINEVRAETGKTPMDGGDEAVIVTTKEIQPISRLSSLDVEQEQQTQIAIQQAQAQVEMTKAQVDKLKNPPAPPPVVVAPHPDGQQPPAPPQQGKDPLPNEQQGKQAKESLVKETPSDFFESGRQWRAPSATQLKLERDLTKAIKAYISKAHISKDGVTLPDETAHDQLQDALQDALTQSVGIGRQIVTSTQQESIVSAAKNIAGRAVQVISDIMAQIKDNAQRLIDNLFGGDEVPDDALDELESQFDEWADGYADMVAQTEVHGAVESAVMDEMADQGVQMVRWIADPDACDECRQLADEGVVDIETGWQGGLIDGPPLHPRCHCVTGSADEE